jgi:hypothetical protein
MVGEKLELAYSLISDLKKLNHVDGVSKLEKKIQQEIKFLLKIQVLFINE